jgi:hypothetical protein
MAALAGITAVKPTSTSVEEKVTWGETVIIGDLVYKDPGTGKYLRVDTNVSAITATIAGIVMTAGALDERGYICKSGSVILVGTTMVDNADYFGGPNPGEIIPGADVASGHYISKLGTADGTTQLDLAISNTNVQRP